MSLETLSPPPQLIIGRSEQAEKSESLAIIIKQLVGNFEPPLEARISYLDTAVYPYTSDTPWFSIGTILNQLKRSNIYPVDIQEDSVRKRIERTIEGLTPQGLPTQPGVVDGQRAQLYPPYIVSWIADEWMWEREYKKLPPKVSIDMMAEYLLGQSPKWVEDTLESLEIVVYKRNKARYPKNTLNLLRKISMLVPCQDGWPTMDDLRDYIEGYTGDVVKEKDVEAWLSFQGFGLEERRSIETGKLVVCYSPESLSLLTSNIPNGGEWLAVDLLSRRTGYDTDRIMLAIQQLNLAGQLRRDDNGLPYPHYPPHTEQEIVKYLRSADRQFSVDAMRAKVTE